MCNNNNDDDNNNNNDTTLMLLININNQNGQCGNKVSKN